MKLLNVKLFFLFVFLSTSGCVLWTKENINTTEFPLPPKYTEPSETPILFYDEKTKTYIITDVTLKNFLLDSEFLTEILMWKRENNIR